MTILRESTNNKHREVESLPLIQCLMSGKATIPIYVSYLFELKEIYKVLEELASKSNLLKDLEGIERYEKIKQDLEELHLNYERDLTFSSQKYISYLKELSVQNPKLLFAHVYVRHMGDLYGGKLMARLVPGSGRCYQFDDRPKIIKVFNEKLTIDLADEANLAFDYFIDIFKELWEIKHLTQ